VNNQGAMALVNWLTSAEGREAIAAFKINGVQMFFPTPK
jgi:tungstate transport system substrate-binding protein